MDRGAAHAPQAQAGHLRRVRLHAALATPAGPAVTTLYAPAGAGKTELVLDWIDVLRPTRRVVYLDLIACDIRRWWQPRTPSPAWWPSDAADMSEVAQILHQRALARAAEAVTIVLDGTEAVQDAAFLAQVRHLAASGSQVHIVLLGRHAPPGRLQQRSDQRSDHVQVTAVAGDALAFTTAETAALCTLGGLHLPPAISRSLFAVTGGWAAGLVLAISALSADPHEPDMVIEQMLRTGAGLAEYIQRDVLGSYPPDIRRAVRDTSIVESICPDLFTAITGRPDSVTILADLARNDMFAARLGPTGFWHRYRQLWRAALYTALTEDAPARARHLHHAAATWYAAHHRPGEALRHALAADDRSLAVHIAHHHTAEIRATTTTAVTAARPRPWSALTGDAPLAYAFALQRGAADHNVTVPSRATQHRQPFTLPAASQPPAPHPPQCTVDPRNNDTPVTSTDPTDSANSPADSPARQIWQALRHGDPDTAQAALAPHLPAAGTGAGSIHPRTVPLLRAVLDRMTGRLHSATRHANDIRAAVQAHGITGSHDEGWALLILADVAVQRHQPTIATRYLDLLAVELRQSDPALAAGERLQLALLDHQQNQHAAALENVEQLIADGDDMLLVPWWAARVLRVELLIAAGLPHDAYRHWRTDAADVPAAAAAVTTAKLRLAQHSPGTIDRLLQPYLHQPPFSLCHQIEVRLLLAHRSNLAGATTHATLLLQQAHTLAVAEQIRHPFLTNRQLLAPTLDGLHTAATAPTTVVPAEVVPAEPAAPVETLSSSEITVLRHLVGFMTVAEIAGALSLSPNTVKSHIAAIYRKLAVHRRRDAVRCARALGIL